MTHDEIGRHELSDFLRTRRARISPVDIGIPTALVDLAEMSHPDGRVVRALILGAAASAPPVHRLRRLSGFCNAVHCMDFRKGTLQLQSTRRPPRQGSCPVLLTNLVLFPIGNRHR
jgi:hypothetical protein